MVGFANHLNKIVTNHNFLKITRTTIDKMATTCDGFACPVPGSNTTFSLSGAVLKLTGLMSTLDPPLVSSGTNKYLAFMTQGVYSENGTGKDIGGLPWPGISLSLSSPSVSGAISILISPPVTPPSTWSGPVTIANALTVFNTPSLANNQCCYVYMFTLGYPASGPTIQLNVIDVDNNRIVYGSPVGALSQSVITSENVFNQLVNWNFKLASTDTNVINYIYQIVGMTTIAAS